MNQNNKDRGNRVCRYATVGALSIGFVCAIIAGFIFQFIESLAYITSLGASEDVMRTAFLKGSLIGGLIGCFVGGLFGALIGSALKRT